MRMEIRVALALLLLAGLAGAAGEEKAKFAGTWEARAKGTVFLVDAKSRQVIWADYEKPARTHLEREAGRIAKKLESLGR